MLSSYLYVLGEAAWNRYGDDANEVLLEALADCVNTHPCLVMYSNCEDGSHILPSSDQLMHYFNDEHPVRCNTAAFATYIVSVVGDDGFWLGNRVPHEEEIDDDRDMSRGIVVNDIEHLHQVIDHARQQADREPSVVAPWIIACNGFAPPPSSVPSQQGALAIENIANLSSKAEAAEHIFNRANVTNELEHPPSP